MEQRIATGNVLIDPQEVLRHANVGYGETIADLGTGAMGYFALQAAKIVGDRGRVFAVDIMKSALSSLDSRAKLSGIHNITTVWSNLEVYGGAKMIPNASCDAAIIVNMLFQSSAKMGNILKETSRMLKPKGRLLVVDWLKRGSPMGPPLHLRIDKEQVESAAEAVGFIKEKDFNPGPHHWGILLSKT